MLQSGCNYSLVASIEHKLILVFNPKLPNLPVTEDDTVSLHFPPYLLAIMVGNLDFLVLTCLTLITGAIGNTIHGITLTIGSQSELAVDCAWDTWSQWMSCSVSCGGGSQKRQRMITQEAMYNGTHCAGEAVERRVCNNDACTGILICKGGHSNLGCWILHSKIASDTPSLVHIMLDSVLI